MVEICAGHFVYIYVPAPIAAGWSPLRLTAVAEIGQKIIIIIYTKVNRIYSQLFLNSRIEI